MSDYIWLIVSLAVAAVVVVILILVNRRKNHPTAAKTQGRQSQASKAVARAKSFARSNGYKVLAPATVAWGDKTASMDALVVGSFGILGVKAYGFNGQIYGAAADEEWLQVAPNGTRNYFTNPIKQAAADVRAVRGVIMNAKLKNVPVEVVCVFTQKKAQLAIPRNVNYYNMKGFKTLLGKEKYQASLSFDVEKAYAALEASAPQAGATS